jgi:hypothetical protein
VIEGEGVNNTGPDATTVNLTPGVGVHRLSVTVTVTSVGLGKHRQCSHWDHWR